MIIGVTGDTHGDFTLERFYNAKAKELDVLIVCGDFGYVWYGNNRENERLDKINKLGITVLFVAGNHENYDLLKSYETVEIFGGKAKKIRNNIYQLLTGEIYDIDNKTFLALGGAESIDKDLRIKGLSWWEEEIPTAEEIQNAKNNVSKRNNKVDFIISHTAFPEAIRYLGFNPKNDKATYLLEWFKDNVEYKQWFFGHMHTNKKIIEYKTTCIYEYITFLEPYLR